jgi:ABC-type dipeptide/oligopeptide/nickel transport system permease component
VSVPRIVQKAATALLFVALVSTVALVLARRAPGDYTDTLRASRLAPDAIERERARLYLDRSIPELCAVWLSGLARGDMRVSYRYARPVTSLLAERLPRTLALVGLALVISIAGGLLWGTVQAQATGTMAQLIAGAAGLLLAVPSLVLLFVLLYAASRAGWLGMGGQGIALPLIGILSLALPSSAALAGLHAEALTSALDEPWAQAARARGVGANRLVWRLAMRIAAGRMASVAPLIGANVLGASLIVEAVTGWAGLGRLTLDAVVSRDVFLVAGCTAAVSTLVAVASLAADAVGRMLDPRIGEHTA